MKSISHVITRRHAHFVERFIRTLNEALHNRIDNERVNIIFHALTIYVR